MAGGKRSRATSRIAARLAVLAAGLPAACGEPDVADRAPAAPVASPAAASPAAPGVAAPAPVFTDVAAEAGLTAQNHTGGAEPKAWLASVMGGGAIVLDYDQDGRMDLVVVDGTTLTEAGELRYDDAARTRVFHNDGGMKFTDVTRSSGVDLQAFGLGGASCDYDGDGRPDFYVCCWGTNRLYRNRGDGTFEDVAQRAGVAGADDDFSTGCAFGDVDGDGIADLYVANYADQRELIERFRAAGMAPHQTTWRGISVLSGPIRMLGQADRLYLGREDGTFRDATSSNLPPEPPTGYGFQPVMTDVDGDGDLDVYVPNDLADNYLLINDGRGRFTDEGLVAGAAVDAGGVKQASMGVDAADVNRDGRIDLFVTNFSHDHNTLYVNRTAGGRASFEDMSVAYNVAAVCHLRVSWGTRLFDYDCDGDLDLFVACGHIYPEIDGYPQIGATYRERCIFQKNVGPPRFAFEDAAERSGGIFRSERVWRGAAFADFDDDGDLDVFVTALNDKPALLRNDGGNANGFLVLRLIGKGRMRDPCGAQVTVFLADGRPHLEELHHGASFCCDNDPRLFFGLGRESAAKRVLVRWPDGEKQSFADVAGRRFYVLEQGQDALREDRR